MKITRDRDVIAGRADLEHLHTFHSFPVFMGTSVESRDQDLVTDMSFWISKLSGIIQLNPLLKLDVLYPESHGAGLVGSSWELHHQSFAEFVSKFNPESVLEIGGAHGILAKNFQSIKSIPWTILEPNPTPVEGCEAKFIKGFFDEFFSLTPIPDAVVHSHVFEHIYDPKKFIKNIADYLQTGKLVIFSVPNMRVMLERKFTNCLNFEHTLYLSDEYIEYLLNINGFSIIEKTFYLDDHSIFYAAQKNAKVKIIALPDNLYERNKKLYLDYIKFHSSLLLSINEKIATHKNKNIFLFGAHVQSQYLIAFGLNIKSILYILDNDKNKYGKRLYGTNKLVTQPSILSDLESPMVVIRAGTFTSEISKQLLSINPNTILVQ
jgi:hypothetical protein